MGNRTSVASGTAVVVQGFRARDGSNRASGGDLTLPDGKKLFIGSHWHGRARRRQRGRNEDARSRSQFTGACRAQYCVGARRGRRPAVGLPCARLSRQRTGRRHALPHGQPDLQGIWTNYTATPFEVPDESDTPELLCRATLDGTGRGTGRNASFLTDTTDRQLTKEKVARCRHPPNGRVPIMPWAEERRNYKLAHIQDDWVNFTPWERCITRGVAWRHLPGRLWLGLPDPAGARLRRDRLRDDPRGAHDPGGRASASRSELPLVERGSRGHWEGIHPGRGYHRLQTTRATSRRERGDPACSRDSAERGVTRRRATSRVSMRTRSITTSSSRIRRSSPLPGRSRCPYTASRMTSSSVRVSSRGTTPSRHTLSAGRARDRAAQGSTPR